MPSSHLAISSDLPTWAKGLALALALASLLLLVVELRRNAKGALVTVPSALVALVLLLLAVLRPVRISARESVVGARVVVLADASRSMALPAGGEPRTASRDRALASLAETSKDARLRVLGFSDGEPVPLPAVARGAVSDLGEALRALGRSADERPAAVVVVSDGRLDDPPESASRDALAALGKELRVPVHTVATTPEAPPDASIRKVGTAGAAVAHVPLPLRIEIGCAGGLACDKLAVTARELKDDAPPALLASGMAEVKDGKGTVDLTITLERAGPRIVEIAIEAPPGDAVPDNDRRFVTFDVARERVRVLHVAGRPTNDVRALRQWLKSDASVDLVAFFILRTQADQVHATQEELALIPFPVEELFSAHLPSFDAIVLQDFDAQPYRLEQYLPAIARYVRAGGGLIMVGGEKSFVAGGYAGTPLADVLPVKLDVSNEAAAAADPTPFVPAWTAEGRAAPLLAPLRAVVGDELPSMPGANVLGDIRAGSVALWTHARRTTRTGAKMPVLAIGDQGDGRSIALGIDGGWTLQFSPLGARTSGRGHGALWDGLLGWLMRDPRFEPAQIELVSGCFAGLPSRVRVRLLPSAGDAVRLDVARLDRDRAKVSVTGKRPAPPADVVELELPALEAGGYTARLALGTGQTTRRDFACEAGGDEWADSRPDPARLRALAEATGGTFVAAGAGPVRLPMPKPTVVSAERHVVPLAPPWLWTLAAALALGVHWIVRRRGGLA